MLLGVQQLARQRMEQQSWSDFVREIEDSNVIIDSSDIREQLSELLHKLKTTWFPTGTSNAGNNSQQCIEDTLFYVESLTLNRSNWALQSIILII